MPILYTPGAPPGATLPEGDTPQFITMDIEWQGADGTSWYLTDPASQIRLLPGIRGLEAGPIERWTSQAPGLAGNRYRGHRALPREVYLPVYLRGASSADWLALRRAWDAGLDPDDEGTLVVYTAGTRRYLPCRWVSTEAGWARDPLLAGRIALGEYLEAAGAHWQGDPITRSWTAETGSDFFLTSGGVFLISPSNTIGSATIDNPGDVPAWPVWTINGPFSTATVGVGSAEVEVPFALTAGHWLRIDTRPDRQSAVDDLGADRVADLGAVAFAPIPDGESVELTVDATGTATGFSVSAEITPLFRRAW